MSILRLTWAFGAAVVFASTARAATPVLGPAELYSPQGETLAFAGGGTAFVSDLSAVDSNPAGLSLGKVAPGYFLASGIHWTERNVRSFELGILDSASSALVGGLKVRRSMQATGAKADRISAGLSEQVGGIPLFFGLAGDLDLYEKPENQAQKERNYRLRAGLLLQLAPSFFVGVRTNGWLDKALGATQTHAVGASWIFATRGAVSVDAQFLEDAVSAYVASAALGPLEWLDLQAGYGYEVESSQQRVSGAVAFRTDKFRVSYSLEKPSEGSLPLRHFVGFSLNVLALEKD
jgi:hypothetical protein